MFHAQQSQLYPVKSRGGEGLGRGGGGKGSAFTANENRTKQHVCSTNRRTQKKTRTATRLCSTHQSPNKYINTGACGEQGVGGGAINIPRVR